MEPLTALARSRPLLTYFALTFAISWGGVLLAIGGSGGLSTAAPTSDPRFLYAVVAMLAGPSLSGILMTGLLHGRRGLRDLSARLGQWRAPGLWYAVALLAAPVLWIATLAALAFAAGRYVPGIVSAPDKLGLLATGLGVAVAAGLFEELGWTGFAIPHLRQRHGGFATGVLVGVPWGAWHLLTNVVWASAVTAGELSLRVFLPVSAIGVLVGYLVAFRVLMVWVYDHTGSLPLAIVMHASLTASVLILDPAALSGRALLVYSGALAAAVWAAAVVITALEGSPAAGQTFQDARRTA